MFRRLLGIQADYPTLRKPDKDSFYQALTQIVENYLGIEFCPYAPAEFEDIDDRTVCIIRVRKSPSPVFASISSKKEFFVRIGNTTRSLNIEDANNYIANHWPPKKS